MARFLTRLRQSRASLLFFLTALSTVVACTLRTVSFFVSFDADVGYFHPASPLVILTVVCILLSVALCAAISFLINNKGASEELSSLPAPRFVAAALCAILLCIAAFYLLIRASKVPAPALLVLLTAFALLAAAAYFLLRLFDKRTTAAVVLGFFTILAAALSLATTYFDRYTPMNAPHKLSLHLCMLAIMFAVLYELRALLGRPMLRACTAATAIAASLCSTYALSNIIAFLGGVYHDLTYFFFDLITLGFAAYFVTKCVQLAALPNAESTEVEK